LALLDHAGGLYFTAVGLAEEMIQAMKGFLLGCEGRPIGQAELWDEIARCPLVVLDELGARERVSDWSYDCVKRLLDEREGKPLLAVSNLDPEALTRVYDDRIASRLTQGAVQFVGGPDRRLDP
jgi:DNA replication protein DnaC